MSHRWTIFDPETDETLTLPINPKETLGPPREKKIDGNRSTQGNPVIFEGRQPLAFMRTNGALLYQADHDFYDAWFDIPNEVLLTDHLDREMWVYLTKFATTFRNRTVHRWSATHETEALFLRWNT